MQITQADIDWTVEFWREVWQAQGKTYLRGVLTDVKTGNSVPIETFIDGFVMLGGGFGTDWKAEMDKFRESYLDNLVKEDIKARFQALEEFIKKNKQRGVMDWSKSVLMDNQENTHKYVMDSEYQVVTESVGSYFVWDKATGACLIQGCEAFEMMVSE